MFPVIPQHGTTSRVTRVFTWQLVSDHEEPSSGHDKGYKLETLYAIQHTSNSYGSRDAEEKKLSPK
jgi:hypothetical protein